MHKGAQKELKIGNRKNYKITKNPLLFINAIVQHDRKNRNGSFQGSVISLQKLSVPWPLIKRYIVLSLGRIKLKLNSPTQWQYLLFLNRGRFTIAQGTKQNKIKCQAIKSKRRFFSSI